MAKKVSHKHLSGALVVNIDGTITGCTHAFEKLSGYDAAYVKSCRLEQLVLFAASDDMPSPRQPVSEGTIAGNLVCANGRHLPVIMTISRDTIKNAPEENFIVIVLHDDTGIIGQRSIRELPIGLFIDDLPCIFYVIDASNHLVDWNRHLEEAVEMSGQELNSYKIHNFFDKAEQPALAERVAEVFQRGMSYTEAELVGRHGRRTPYMLYFTRVHLGEKTYLFAMGLDLSERKRTEKVLAVRERALYSSVNAIVITCCDGDENRIEYVNPAFEKITGYSLEEIKGRDPRLMAIEGCDQHERIRIRDAIKRKESVRSVIRNVKKNGEVFWNDLRIDPVTTIEGNVTHFVAVINDITETKHNERRLLHLAHHDPLTGLANRTLLLEKLRFSIESTLQSNALRALAFLDLDNFKHINDSFGHDVGDRVLREVADRLKANMRDEDTVARLGGDEFVLLISEQPSHIHVAELLERIRRSISAPMMIGEHEIILGTSIGVSLFPDDGDNIHQVMHAADAAMYHAKSLGKNNVQFYSAQLGRAMHHHRTLQASLGRAICGDELMLFYQPKVSLRSGKVIGAEALVRWNHPDSGVTQPNDFIPLAEETGLIVSLGDWVIEEVCRTLTALQSHGMHDFVISVNLSARQLYQHQFSKRLATILDRHHIDPGNLELEITETQLMERPADAIDILHQLKAMGIWLSIDDFGTASSNLIYLEKFPVDYIKIDRSILPDFGENANTVITRAIIALAHALKLQVIAEGVETLEQLNFLRENDCDQMQGFYFSSAIPCLKLLEMLCGDIRLRP